MAYAVKVSHVCVCVCARARVLNLEYSRDLWNYIQKTTFCGSTWFLEVTGLWELPLSGFHGQSLKWIQVNGQRHFHESGFLIEERGWPLLSFMFASSCPSDSCHGWLGNKTFNRYWDLELWPWPSFPVSRLSGILLSANDLPYRILS